MSMPSVIISSRRARGLLAGGIGVEERHDLVGVAPQQPELGGVKAVPSAATVSVKPC